jgi:glycosyltransferase involved in cell wall biosynthesis
VLRNKILIHSIVFSPDGVSTAYLYNDIALRFKEEGYEVVVLSTTPHYNVLPSELKKQPLVKKMMGLYYESNFHGIRVLHVPQKKFKNSIFRITGFIYWHFLSFFLGLAQKNVKLILSPSPPLTIGMINLLIGKIKGAKVIYNVQEIYPDFLINQGKLKLKPIIAMLKSMERFVYNSSNAVVTIDEVFYRTISDRFDDKSKLSIIPNFVDTEIYKPISIEGLSLDPVNFPERKDCLKVMYAGNIGHAQSWEPLLEAAKELLSQNIEFWVIGEGVMKSYLEEQVSLFNLTNIHLVPYQNREQMPALIAYADLHFIFMSPEMEGQGFPSKVYTIMACAKPLLIISGENTPICNFLRSVNSAYLIHEKQIECQSNKVIGILNNLMQDKSELRVMGENGYKHIANTYSKHIVTMQYLNLGNRLINKK